MKWETLLAAHEARNCRSQPNYLLKDRMKVGCEVKRSILSPRNSQPGLL